MLDGWWLDLRSAIRSLRARPGFTAVAVATLALGIGVNVAVFSVVSATVLRDLPYGDPDRLVRFSPDSLFPIGVADFAALRDAPARPADISAYGRTLSTFTGGAEPEMVRGAMVSSNHFDVLGVRPLLGRGFEDGEGEPGRDRVLILGHAFWQRRWGGDAGIVGNTVEVSGEPWLVAGVMPSTHQPLEFDWQYWTPLDADPSRDSGRALAPVGRLAPGVSMEQATAFYTETLVERWRTVDYEATPDDRQTMYAASLRGWILGAWRARLLLLLGAVALVLITACANVGNLMLGRAVARFDELGLRAALGAGRGRVTRLLLVEAGVLASLGAAVGVAGAWVLVGIARGAIPHDVPRAESIAIDSTVLGYAVVLTCISALAFGLVPALRGARQAGAARGGARTTVSTAESKLARGFVGAQVALSVILVVAAGLLLRSFWRLQSVEPGFRPEGVVALRPAPPGSAYPDDVAVRTYHETLTAALRGMDFVREVGGIMFLPMHPGGWWTRYTVEGAADGTGEGRAAGRVVTDHYFDSMGIPLLAGRAFESADRDGPPVVLINQTLASAAFPGEDPVGRVLLNSEGVGREVVGVVGDVRQEALGVVATPEIYVPYTQQQWRNMYFTVRVDGDAAAHVSRIRDAVRTVDPRVPINNLGTMSDVVAATSSGSKFLAVFVVGFGLVALTLGMIGVYGVTAHAVARQRRDIGIRLAVGAGQASVLRQTLVRGATPVVAGVIVGMAGAAAASSALQGLLYEIEPLDLTTFAAVPAVLVAAALVALWVPARRATRVDPAVVLRDG